MTHSIGFNVCSKKQNGFASVYKRCEICSRNDSREVIQLKVRDALKHIKIFQKKGWAEAVVSQWFTPLLTTQPDIA